MRFLVPFLALLSLAAPARAELPFVRVDGVRLRAGDRPFAFVGANVEVMHGERARARVEETLEAARKDGLTVVRVWALGEGPADASSWSRQNQLFRAGPDGFLESSYAQLDRVLLAARKSGLRVILTLANYWPDYGGVPMYLAWAGLPTEGFAARDRFFADERTRALYRAHLERLVDRTNALTGVRYADDPTILSWELINESMVDSPEGARARRAWIEEMAGLLRSHDPHHLVTPGVIGYTTLRERSEWLDVCRLPAVDYCDSHLYPQTSDSVPTLAMLQAFIDDRVQLARFVAKKPIVFGEFGFDTRRAHDGWLGRGRADWFTDFLGRVFFDGAAGALVWIYQPWSGHERDFGIYTDRPETDDVRARLQRVAAELRLLPEPLARNPLLGEARGERPLYDPYHDAHHPGPAFVTDGKQATTVALLPDHFAHGRFERVGAYRGGALVHAYGSGDGFFEWRFPAPAFSARSLTLAVRLSSEFPGSAAPPDGGSTVRVLLDGRELGTLEAPPDDGLGQLRTLSITDRSLLAQLAGQAHTLRLEVAPGPHGNGLCVYGLPTGNAPAPDGSQPITLTFAR